MAIPVSKKVGANIAAISLQYFCIYYELFRNVSKIFYEFKSKKYKMNLLKKLVLALPVAFFAGCQTMPYQPYAREVKRKPGVGGEIALKTEHRDEDRAKAQATMDSNCGSSIVKVEEEGEVTVGQTTNSQTNQDYRSGTHGAKVGSLFGVPIVSGGTSAGSDTTGTSVTTDLREWVIKYSCATVTASAAASSSTTPAKAVPKDAAPIRRQRKAEAEIANEETQGL